VVAAAAEVAAQTAGPSRNLPPFGHRNLLQCCYLGSSYLEEQVIRIQAVDRTRVVVLGVAAVGTVRRRAAVRSLRRAAAEAVQKRVVLHILAVAVHTQTQGVVHKKPEAVVRTTVAIRKKLQTIEAIAVAAPGADPGNSCCRAAELPAEGQERVHRAQGPSLHWT